MNACSLPRQRIVPGYNAGLCQCRQRPVAGAAIYSRDGAPPVLQSVPIHLDRLLSDLQKICIVTGAGSGIGRAVAKTLLRAGHAVVLAGRREQPLRETAAGFDNDRNAVVPTDVTDADAVDTLFEQCRERFGRVDVLFNNAGINLPATPVDEIEVDAWRRVVDVNLTGMFLCTRAAFRMMRAQDPMGGRIINNGSISAYAPRPGSAAYTATKHAVAGLTKATSLDGRPYDIACSQIDIGNAATEMTAGMSIGTLQADGRMATEPTMDVQHVADAVLYMVDLPLGANVQAMTLLATKMPFVGRG